MNSVTVVSYYSYTLLCYRTSVLSLILIMTLKCITWILYICKHSGTLIVLHYYCLFCWSLSNHSQGKTERNTLDKLLVQHTPSGNLSSLFRVGAPLMLCRSKFNLVILWNGPSQRCFVICMLYKLLPFTVMIIVCSVLGGDIFCMDCLLWSISH